MSHTDHILNVMGEKIKLAPGLVERLEFQKEFEDAYDEATLRQVPALATSPSTAFAVLDDGTFAFPGIESAFQVWKKARSNFRHKRIDDLEHEVEVTTRITNDSHYDYLNDESVDRTELTESAFSFVRWARSVRNTGFSTPGLENFQFLASFYGVDTVEELISAQEHQITRLQERIPQDQQCVLTTPREG